MSLVLVIDDSATFRAAMASVLEGAGYRVAMAASGEEGLRAAWRLRPDVIVVDNVLPDFDGTVVIQNIRLDAALRRTPCLLITASDSPQGEFEALNLGADAYVAKAADMSVLLARVAALDRVGPGAAVAPAAGDRRHLLVFREGREANPVEGLPSEEYDVRAVDAPKDLLEAIDARLDGVVVMAPRVGLPEMLAAIRATPAGAHVPLFVVGHTDDPADACVALAAGADDYAPSGSAPILLLARLRALMRRKDVEAEDRRVREQLIARETEAAEARLRAEMAERESEFKSRFVAIMSHELRTPLNAIIGYGHLLEVGTAGELNDTQRGYVKTVMRNSQHLLALVNDVLDLSSIRAGKLRLHRSTVDIAAAAETAVSSVEPMASPRGVSVAVDIADPLPAVDGDPVRVQQVLFNLLSNGIKFTPEGGRVTLTIAHDGDAVTITVADTGIGIKEEDLPRLFREFERLDQSEAPHAGGTGLGLALTRHLVELHGGRIEVASRFGKGTTFSVRLPAAAVAAN